MLLYAPKRKPVAFHNFRDLRLIPVLIIVPFGTDHFSREPIGRLRGEEHAEFASEFGRRAAFFFLLLKGGR